MAPQLTDQLVALGRSIRQAATVQDSLTTFRIADGGTLVANPEWLAEQDDATLGRLYAICA